MNWINRNNIINAVIAGMLVLNVFFWVSLALPQKYEAKTKILFIQQQTVGVDVYTASKSSERVASSFSEVINSGKFLNLILKNPQIQSEAFKTKGNIDLDKWGDTVDVDIVKGSGILEIAVYHPIRSQAELIANQVVRVMEEQGSDFHGGGANIRIVSLDSPEVSQRPVRPNIPVNILFGFLLGVTGYVVFKYIFQDAGSFKKLISRKTAKETEERIAEEQPVSQDFFEKPATMARVNNPEDLRTGSDLAEAGEYLHQENLVSRYNKLIQDKA